MRIDPFLALKATKLYGSDSYYGSNKSSGTYAHDVGMPDRAL